MNKMASGSALGAALKLFQPGATTATFKANGVDLSLGILPPLLRKRWLDVQAATKVATTPMEKAAAETRQAELNQIIAEQIGQDIAIRLSLAGLGRPLIGR
jgi:hypothetical protein